MPPTATGMAVNTDARVIPGKVINSSGSATIQDLPFAVAFLASAAGIVALAVSLPHFGELVVAAKGKAAVPAALAVEDSLTIPYDVALVLQYALAAATLGAVLFSSCWLLMMRAHARFLVTAALIVPIVLCVALTLWAAYLLAFGGVDGQSSMLLGVFGLIGTAINFCWLQAMWHKIPATAHALSLSSHVIFTLPATVVIAFVSALLQIGWLGVTAVAAVNVHVALTPIGTSGTSAGTGPGDGTGLEEGEGGGAAGLALVLVLLTLYWGWQVLSNVSYVTTCGSVASWYFYPEASERGVACCKPVVWEALGRACTTSFGSICGGSLLVALVQTIGTLLRHIELKAREEGNPLFILITCCFRCLFSFIESLLEMFNEWAYVYVAIYGTSFATAGRAVLRMVNEEGLSAILSSIVADRVVGYGVLFSTLVGGGAGFLAPYMLYADTSFAAEAGAAGAVPSLILGLLLGLTCLGPVNAAIRTSLVCFAEAPSTLRVRDAKLHDAFVELQVKPDPNAPQRPTAIGVPVAQPAAMV